MYLSIKKKQTLTLLQEQKKKVQGFLDWLNNEQTRRIDPTVTD